MSLFSSAIQTLSSMAINEAAVDIPQTADQSLIESVIHELDGMPYVNMDEMRFLAEMVPVRKSPRLGRYLIEMEDLSRYMFTNRIQDAKQAVCNILECNGLIGQFNNVAIVIDEASLLEDLEELGYNVTGFTLKTPPKGLGLGMITKNQDDFKKIRRIANSKQMMDVLTGRYGLPLIKKNYQQEGLLEAAEDVQIKKKADEEVIHEGDKKKSSPKKDDEEKTKPSKGEKAEDSDPIEPDEGGDSEIVEESAGIDYNNMSAHDLRIQHLREIAAGKYDDDMTW